MLSRRACLLLALMAPARGATREEILEAIEPLAAALSQGNAVDAMRPIARDAPDRDRLRANIEGLLDGFEVTSSVDVVSAADGALDWYMQIRSRATGTLVERRRDAVTVALRGAKLAAIRPVDFFAPPRP